MTDTKDIFLSYIILTDHNLQNSENPLTAQLGNGITNSPIFLCCITEDYCKSHNCNLEIEYANSKDKHIVPLMIQKIDKIKEIKVNGRNHKSGIDFIIKNEFCFYSSWTRLNCYKNQNWPLDKKEEILKSIENNLNVFC